MSRALIGSIIVIATAGLSAHAQRTSRLGNDPVLFGDDTSYWSLDETFAPIVNSANDTSTLPGYPGVAPTRGFGVDLRSTLAWVYEAQWIVGLTYNHEQLKGKRDLVAYGQDALVQSTTRDEWGPTVGWTDGGWRLTFTYFLSGWQRVSSVTNNYAYTTGNVVMKNRGMEGLQVSLGYTFMIMGRVYLGPSLVYRAVKYHRQARANAYSTADSYDYQDLYRAMVNDDLSPMLTVALRF